MIKNISDLHKNELIDEAQVSSLQEVVAKFPVLLTPTLTNLIEQGVSDAVKKQFIPSIEELQQDSVELVDPTGDEKYQKVTGVIHRYPDRCLLKVVSSCPVYCRFCFRKEMIGPGNLSLTSAQLEEAYDYIQSDSRIWEVILTGGDPLILKPKRLNTILERLSAIKHVSIIRFHTRIPVMDPSRISNELINVLSGKKTIYVVLHANHFEEFSEPAIQACTRIVAAGIPMLSQTVLLRGVNDDVDTLATLMRTFVQLRIKPYYLHHPDLAKGTGHFRVPIEQGQRLMRELQGKVSGLCMPTYMLEIPGGGGKMPIGPCYAREHEGVWLIEDHLGQTHVY